MHCNSCGCILHEGEQFCPGCGKPVAPATLPPAVPVPPVFSRPIQPPMYIVTGEPSGMATASMICGFFFFLTPVAILAIILGHVALSEIKKSGGRLLGHGRAVAGLVLGYIGIAFIPLLLIVAAIAIPNLLRAKIAANEASAVGSLRTISTAEATYRIAFPNVGYACELYQLGGDSQRTTSTGAGLINNALSAGDRNGYHFRVFSCTAPEDGQPYDKFVVIAEPQQRGASGSHSFCVDETGEIKRIAFGQEDRCEQFGSPI